MAIKTICNRCGKEIKEFSGIIFSPPKKKNIVRKYHLCTSCFNLIIKDFRSKSSLV